MRNAFILSKIFSATLMAFIVQNAMALNPQELTNLVKVIDDRQSNSGDYMSEVILQQTEKNKSPRMFEARVYRRDADEKWAILFTAPKAEAGKGYLRLEKNLFLFEPALGKWERQTERASIAGTGSRRQDFDKSRLAEEYTASLESEGKLGKFTVWNISLVAKSNVDVASPKLKLAVDKESQNILKRQEFAFSDKLLRTIYYPAWEKKFSKSKNADVYVPKEIRVFDEIEKGNSTTVVLKDVNLDPLPANIFTKAWLEAQSK